MPRKIGLLAILLACVAVEVMAAQEAVVKVNVRPDEAYIFVDGEAVHQGAYTLKLSPGQHTIGVYNYGFNPIGKEVTLEAGKGNQDLMFRLEPTGGLVSGPWGVIYIQGAPRSAVLLNGTHPEYFVGHGDALDNHIWWKQQLIVPAGTHFLVVKGGGLPAWSGKVEVPANKRVMIDFNHNAEITVKDWPEGATMASQPRFQAGTASATVAVAPVTGTFSADPKQINCNEKATLAWNTAETLHTAITSDAENFPEQAATGSETVSPKQTTTYKFRTSGPGGIIESAETVTVNPVVKADLTPSTEDVHYLRIGDKVIVQDHATLTWNVANADNLSVEPLGTVGPNGSNTVTPTPNENATGAINETHSYKLAASNVCGGADTKVADVHVVGKIEPVISSVFFPTGYPDRGHPQKGLLKSQQERLAATAALFKLYSEHAPDAKLDIIGMADPRGPTKSNQALSARRAMIVKDFLIAQGIPADRITLQIRGESSPLALETVEQLEATNPQAPNPNWVENPRPTKLAYDRRVDVAIMPATVESARFFPHAADDSALLFNPRWVGEEQIHPASE